MATITISVDYNPAGSDTHKLTLTDSEGHIGVGSGNDHDDITTEIRAGDTIQWVIVPGSRVTAITAISAKSGNSEFLENKTMEPTTGNYIATVKQSIHANDVESYNISFKIDGADTVYIDDPKMVGKP